MATDQTQDRIRATTIVVDLDRIEENTRTLTDRLPGLSLVGVTKVTCGDEAVGAAMLRGGAAALADSRLANLARLRAAGITAPLWLLRSPTPGQAEDTVRLADVSLESELETVRALDTAAAALGVTHDVVCMVDLGDLREGVLPEDLPVFVERVTALRHVRLAGIGVNLTCYGAIIPTRDNLGLLVELADDVRSRVGRPIVVSGGNSGSLPMALAGDLPPGIDSLRVGESILQGLDSLTREPLLPELHRDAFVLRAPVIECLVKPSRPIGQCGQDAFGAVPPSREDRGRRRRALLALGRQDTIPDLLTPTDPRVEVLGASSDHLIVDVQAVEPPPAVGDAVEFIPGYGAVLQAFTSPYVEKRFVGGPAA